MNHSVQLASPDLKPGPLEVQDECANQITTLWPEPEMRKDHKYIQIAVLYF